MNCPVCNKLLTERVLDGETIAVCDEHGVWLDKGELMAITEEERFKPHSFWEDLFRREIETPRRDDRRLACPRCSELMVLDDYHGVQIDRCLAHGVWLDAGEMEAILNNIRLDPAYMRGIAIRLADAAL